MEEIHESNPIGPEAPPQDSSVFTNTSDSDRKKAKMAQHIRTTLSLLRSMGNGLLKILSDVRVAVLKR